MSYYYGYYGYGDYEEEAPVEEVADYYYEVVADYYYEDAAVELEEEEEESDSNAVMMMGVVTLMNGLQYWEFNGDSDISTLKDAWSGYVTLFGWSAWEDTNMGSWWNWNIYALAGASTGLVAAFVMPDLAWMLAAGQIVLEGIRFNSMIRL